MNTRIAGLLLFVCGSGVPFVAHGAPIVTYDGGTGYATGIRNLDLNASLFNVDFVGGSYDSVFALDAPRFLGDELGAEAAADAVQSVLNNELAVPEIAAGSSEILWIPYEETDANTFRTEQRGHNTDAAPWQPFGDFVGSRATDFSGPPSSWLFAKFSQVPEPTSLALIVAACAGGAFTRRR